MLTSLSSPQRRGKLLFGAAVLLLFAYFMFWQVNWYLAENLKLGLYLALAPVLIAGALYFGRSRYTPEFKLLLGYCVWLVISRILCGDRVLSMEYVNCLDLWLMLPFVMLGLVLDREERRRFLGVFSAVVGGFYFLLGLPVLYAFERRVLLVNPITQGCLGIQLQEGFQRVNILDTNVNISSCWYMVAFLLMLYQFFACRRKLWRVPIVLAALVHYLVIAATYTRSVKLALSVCVGLLFSLLMRKLLKSRRPCLRIPLTVLLSCGAGVLFYFSFDLAVLILGFLSIRYFSTVPGLTLAFFLDPRSMEADIEKLSHGRMAIYRAAFRAIETNPGVLLRGSLQQNYMDIARPYMTRDYLHYHDFLLDTLMLTGLPGLLLAVGFTLLVVGKGIRLFFCADPACTTAERATALTVAAILLYGLFEQCVYTSTNVRTLFFFLMAGFVLGRDRELFPRPKKR